MVEIEKIQKELSKSYLGEAWHGPSLKQTLAGISAEEARFRVNSNVHTIGEIVLHLGTWMRSVQERINHTQPFSKVTDEEDWPRDSNANDWNRMMKDLDSDFDQLLQAVGQLEASQLLERIPTTENTPFELIFGIIQHNIYHAGQIALLKKAQIGGAQ